MRQTWRRGEAAVSACCCMPSSCARRLLCACPRDWMDVDAKGNSVSIMGMEAKFEAHKR